MDLVTIEGKWDFNYTYFAGESASRFFHELRENQRIMGTRCTKCEKLLVPARAYCDVCMAKTDEWRKLIGQSSFSHEARHNLDVKNLKPEHPVMKGFPAEWKDPVPDELYKNEKLWPDFIPLAQAYGVDTKKDHACIWVNTYGKGKIFGTTLGHDNKTMETDVYLDLVTRGLLWATGHLNEDGTPAKGYGSGGK